MFVERFRREAQAAANLSHPNIVPVFDWGEDEGTYFIVMELVDGTSLADMLRGSRRLRPRIQRRSWLRSLQPWVTHIAMAWYTAT